MTKKIELSKDFFLSNEKALEDEIEENNKVKWKKYFSLLLEIHKQFQRLKLFKVAFLG